MLKVKSYFLTIWNLLDPLYYSLTRLVYVNPKTKRNVFRVRLARYRGKSLQLSDGTFIQKNDILLKIHLHNVTLLKDMIGISNRVVKARKIYRTVEKSMPDLTEFIRNHPKGLQIKGIMGITTLNRGSRELGFEIFPIQSSLYLIYKWTTLLPIYLLSAANPLKMFRKHVPSYLLMSKEYLFNKYGT